MGANFNYGQANSQTFGSPNNANGPMNSQPFGSPYNANDPMSQAAYASSMGNYYGAKTATAANRVNQETPYGSLKYEQTGTDSLGNPTYTAKQTLNPQLQSAVDTSLGGLSAYNTPFQGKVLDPNSLMNPQSNLPSYGINPNQSYSDAIMQRLQPSLDRQSSALNARLANQGIKLGTKAYNTAQTLQGQNQNDALTSAIVGGMDVGLRANQQQFGQNIGTNAQDMQSNLQAYNQNLSSYQMPLTTASGIKALTSQNYVNPYSQAAVAGPDYLGAAGLSNQNAIGIQNANNANRANMQSGLFNLGSALLSNPYAMKGIGSGLSSAYDYITS